MRSSAAALSLCLALAACGPGEEGATTSSQPGTTTTEATTTTTMATTTTTEPTTTPGSLGGDPCLIGIWQASPESLQEQYRALLADSGIAVGDLTGGIQLQIREDGTATYSFQDLTVSAQVSEEEVGEAELRIMLDGDAESTWSADGSEITITSGASDIDISSSIVVGDQVIEGGDIAIGDEAEPQSGTVAYTCTETTLTFEAGDDTGVVDEYQRIEG